MHEINRDKWYSGVDVGEALRYAGVRNPALCGDEIRQSAIDAINEAGDVSVPKKIIRECTVRLDGAACDIDGIVFDSASLAGHLQGCDRALLLAATLGSGIDILIMRHSAVRMSYALMLQAAAAALIEYYCDAVSEELERRYGGDGYYLKPRFSPGYGDFPLACQSEVLSHLHAYKYTGITVSGGGQMTPMKSVTAVIGMTKEWQGSRTGSCASGKCAGCSHLGCEFRRQ